MNFLTSPHGSLVHVFFLKAINNRLVTNRSMDVRKQTGYCNLSKAIKVSRITRNKKAIRTRISIYVPLVRAFIPKLTLELRR